MFDKIVEFLISIIELFKFWVVIRQWQSGVNLRLGRWTGKVLKPGFHYIFPFGIDEVSTIDMIPTVAELDPQTVLTKDKVVVVTQALVKYQVVKPEVCLIEVNNEEDAVKEFTQGAIHTIIAETDYATADVKEIQKKAKEEAHKEVIKWGIKINSVVLKSFGKMSSLRLLNSK